MLTLPTCQWVREICYSLPQKTQISSRENVCQEFGCARGVGAGLMQVYIAHAAPFGN